MVTKITEHGLPLDESFAEGAGEEALQETSRGLRGRGHAVVIAEDADAARRAVRDALPAGRGVFTMSSETLKAIGVEEEINASGRYDAIRPRIYAMDFATQREEIRRLGASADVVVGSVHAVTRDGTLVATSATGSQLALYAFGAGRVVLVVGWHKLVPDLDTAMRRLRTYSWPLEDIRFRVAHGQPSVMRKTLIVESEPYPERSTIVLVREALGY